MVSGVIHVDFEIRLPVEATEDEVTEWLKFVTREDGRGIRETNPLIDAEMEALWQTLRWKRG